MFADGVMEETDTLGLVSYNLLGPVYNGLAFNQKFLDGELVVAIAQTLNRNKFEIFIGTYTDGPPRTLTRTTILSSSAGGSKINWQAGDNYYIATFASADALAGLSAGNLATSKPWWSRTGSRWFDHTAGLAVSWIEKLVTGISTDTRIGFYDAVKGVYFPDSRVSSTNVGAANKTFGANDVGGSFVFNTAAANRTATLPNAATAKDGYTLTLYGTDPANGIVLTPASGGVIDGGAADATKTIPGGIVFTIRYDASLTQWITNYLTNKEVDIASAATTSIGAAKSSSLRVTGTTTISSFGNAAEGFIRYLRFAGALTLTHSASLDLSNGGSDIKTAAGDTLIVRSLGSGNWKVLNYQTNSGRSASPGGGYADTDLTGYALASAYSNPFQITEGIQLFSHSYTAPEDVVVTVEVDVASCQGQNVTQAFGIFKDGATNAVAVSIAQFTNVATHAGSQRVVYTYTSDGAAHTISVRVAGGGNIGTATVMIREFKPY